MSRVYKYRVLSSELQGSTLVTLLHAEPRQRPIAFRPGQYVAISFWRHGRPTPTRCFSITSSPTDEPKLQVAMHIQGDYTKAALDGMRPGAQVLVEGPFGNFIFDRERDQSLVMMAGGIGITPFMSILRYASRLQLSNDLILLYACHSQDEVSFLEEIVRINRVNKRLSVVFVISHGGSDKLRGLHVVDGHLDAALLDSVLRKQYVGRSYFICGPAGFMSGLVTTLQQCGVAEDNIFTEAFQQGQRGPRSLRHNVPAQVYALTGLSLVLSSATIMVRDVLKPPQYAVNSAVTAQTGSGASSSRQADIGQAVAGLQGSPAAASSTASPPASTSSPIASKAPAKAGSSSAASVPAPTSSSSSGGTSKTVQPPSAPAPVAPVLNLIASAAQITSGQSASLSWSINTNATTPVSCAASGGWSGAKASTGSQTVSPTTTTTYSLTCSNSAGSSAKSVTITVQPACVSTPSKPC